MESKISPYFDFIKRQYLKLVYVLPYNLLKLFLSDDETINGKRIKKFKIKTANEEWVKSKYTKIFLKESGSFFEEFHQQYEDRSNLEVNIKIIEITFRLIEQFLSHTELEHLVSDYITLIEDILETDFDNPTGDLSQKDLERLEQLQGFFKQVPGKNRNLSTLMMELPYLVYVLIADADGVIDNKERLKFQEMFRNREWCKSKCAQFILLSTEYGYEELHCKYARKALKADFKQVLRTLNMMDDILKTEELNLIKLDLIHMAFEIAKSSGGFAGLKSINDEEEAVMLKLQELFTETGRQPKKVGRKPDTSAGTDDVVEKLFRSQPRVFIPNAQVLIGEETQQLSLSQINITTKSILCDVDLSKHYVDVSKGIIISLKLPYQKKVVLIPDIPCKTIRTQITDWNEENRPLQMKVVWQFTDLSVENENALQRVIDLYRPESD